MHMSSSWFVKVAARRLHCFVDTLHTVNMCPFSQFAEVQERMYKTFGFQFQKVVIHLIPAMNTKSLAAQRYQL